MEFLIYDYFIIFIRVLKELRAPRWKQIILITVASLNRVHFYSEELPLLNVILVELHAAHGLLAIGRFGRDDEGRLNDVLYQLFDHELVVVFLFESEV